MKLKFINVFDIKEISLVDYENAQNIIKKAVKEEKINNITIYVINDDEFLIVGKELEDILKGILRLSDDFEEIKKIISIIINKLNLSENININRLTIKLFPVLYIKYLNKKKRKYQL